MVSILWENIFRRGEDNQVLKVLKQNVLFKDLNNRELKFVNNIIHVRSYRPGEKVFRQDEVGVGMYILVSGNVDIVVEDRSQGEARDVLITKLQKGDFFGELSLIEENGRRSATAIAHNETQLIGFFKPDLMEILERNPSIGVKVVFRLAEVLGGRLLKTTEKISDMRRDLQDIQGSPKGL